jgi:hypothetical protein
MKRYNPDTAASHDKPGGHMFHKAKKRAAADDLVGG